METTCFVIGSCVSRDMFNSRFVPQYKTAFELQVMQFQMSMLSILEPAIGYPGALWDDSKMTINNYSHMRSELNKKVLDQLIYHQPKYLIMDFFADVEHGAIKISNGQTETWVTDKSQIFSQNPLWSYFDILDSYTPDQDFDTFFKVWQVKFDAFVNWVTNNLPNTEIIINKAKFTTHLINESGELEEISKKLTLDQIAVKNERWMLLDNYATETHGLRYLEYPLNSEGQFPYLGDINHMWGRYVAHYENQYYLDMFEQLRWLTEEPKNNMATSKVYERLQLVPNHDFALMSASWEIDPGFVYTGHGMAIEKSVDTSNPFASTNLKSEAIQLNLKQPTTFILEAEFKIDLRATHPDRAILFVRGFNRYQEQTVAASTENHEFFVKDFIESAKKQSTVVDTRSEVTMRIREKIVLNSKFARVIPYLGNKGKMEVLSVALYEA